MSAGVIAGVLLVFLLLGYLVYALINAEAFLMAAQGFLLIATFLLVLMVLARPLGSGLARLINDIPSSRYSGC
ncbi:potassium-transporting ATPase subunit A [Escherichia coli]|uniref:Potassium-transporting ATPase subunit A n=16 Tax=Enterobacteriaceae TaxID=543 RepID=A0A376W1V6_ECOLX|nr:potassium-transporting ATPase subunit A [Escherichia coli]